MTRKATASIPLIHVLLSYAASRNIDPVKICQSANFPLDQLNDPEVRIPAGQFYDLWLLIAEQVNDPDFGLHVAEPTRSLFGGDILGAVMLNCPTVGSAMEKLIRYHDLSTDVVQVKLVRERNQVLYAWVLAFGDGLLDRQISEAITSRIFFTIESLSNGKMPFAQIRFRHPRPEKTTEHQRIFGCPVLFEQGQNAVVIQENGLGLPIPLANPKLLDLLEKIAQELLQAMYQPDTWSDRVSHWISKMLLQGEKPTLEMIARNLALSPRHLQNKLGEENTTYRTLLDQVRKEMALQYLQGTDINILDTAFLLGFSDQSAFNHAFKRWTGKTPGEFRQ